MRSTTRRYQWIGGIAILGVVIITLFNSLGVWKIPSFHLLRFEIAARGIVNSSHAPQAWVAERTKLLEQLTQLKELADENAHLREVLNFYSKKKFSYTIANAISRDPLSASLVYLDVGSDDGLAVGQAAVVGDGVMVGKVVKVSQKHATLELLTGDSARIAVKALDDTSTSGILRGRLGTGARLEYIRDAKAVPVGSIIVTSGLEPLIPQGLVVGTIQKITENDNALFAYADVLPAADLSQVSIISILHGL